MKSFYVETKQDLHVVDEEIHLISASYMNNH